MRILLLWLHCNVGVHDGRMCGRTLQLHLPPAIGGQPSAPRMPRSPPPDPNRCERAYVGNTIGQANAVSDKARLCCCATAAAAAAVPQLRLQLVVVCMTTFMPL